jgi:Hemerythrin HHE cation binding domain
MRSWRGAVDSREEEAPMIMFRSPVQHDVILSTDNLRRQHRELLRLAREIAARLHGAAIMTDAAKLRSQIAMLSGILNVHLAMEDGVMYPRLRLHEDPRIRALAARYVDEMGDLKKTFVDYSRRWNTPEAMRAAPGDFIRESRAVLDALTRRIGREAPRIPTSPGSRSTGSSQRTRGSSRPATPRERMGARAGRSRFAFSTPLWHFARALRSLVRRRRRSSAREQGAVP